MTDAMEALYDYAQKYLLPGYLCRDETYAASERCAGQQEELLRAGLPEGAQGHLKDLLDELEIARFARDRAAFRCGFRLALELAGR